MKFDEGRLSPRPIVLHWFEGIFKRWFEKVVLYSWQWSETVDSLNISECIWRHARRPYKSPDLTNLFNNGESIDLLLNSAIDYISESYSVNLSGYRYLLRSNFNTKRQSDYIIIDDCYSNAGDQFAFCPLWQWQLIGNAKKALVMSILYYPRHLSRSNHCSVIEWDK